MCHTGGPLGGPCKHCSVTALITQAEREKEREVRREGKLLGGGGGCDNEGEGGMKARGQKRTLEGEEEEGEGLSGQNAIQRWLMKGPEEGGRNSSRGKRRWETNKRRENEKSKPFPSPICV